MFCNQCGKQLPDEARFCTGCGARTALAPAPEPPKPIPPEPKPAPEAPKKKKKGLLITLLILIPLALAIIGVGVWHILENLDSQSQSQEDDEEDEEDKLEADYKAAKQLLKDRKYDKALEAFKALGDYEDSAEQVEKLEQLQENYDAAWVLMTDQKYDDAIKAFEKLEDYRDSEEMATQGVPYEQAMDVYNDAQSIDDFLSAAETFRGMSGYRDADTMTSMAFLNVCKLYLLEENDLDSALANSVFLNDEHYSGFQTILYDNSGDCSVLEALEQALSDRLALSDSGETDYSEFVQAELEYMLRYRDIYFLDEELYELICNYIAGLELQLDSLDGGDYPTVMVDWYRGAAIRSSVISTLAQDYDFLADNDALYEDFVDRERLYEAMIEIQALVEEQLWGIVPLQDAAGNYYLMLFNETDYDYSLELLQRYGNNGSFLDVENRFVLEVMAGETVKVPLQFPKNMEFSQWYIDWAIYNVYYGDNKLS